MTSSTSRVPRSRAPVIDTQLRACLPNLADVPIVMYDMYVSPYIRYAVHEGAPVVHCIRKTYLRPPLRGALSSKWTRLVISLVHFVQFLGPRSTLFLRFADVDSDHAIEVNIPSHALPVFVLCQKLGRIAISSCPGGLDLLLSSPPGHRQELIVMRMRSSF